MSSFKSIFFSVANFSLIIIEKDSSTNFNVYVEFLCIFFYTCTKNQNSVLLVFFSLNASKTLFKQSLLLQKVLSLIRLNYSHNLSHCGCQQHSANVMLCVKALSVKRTSESVLYF